MKKLIVAALFFAMHSAAIAKAPDGPVSVINPFTVGGLTDLTVRFIVDRIKTDFPDGIAVVNRPGAGGSIGITEVVQAEPDGRVIGFTPFGAVVDQPQMNDLPYKTPDDFDPIINTIASYQLLVVRGSSEWKNAEEFIAHIKSSPGKVLMGSSGIGTASHLNLVELEQAAELKFVQVPFSGWAEGSAAVLGGHVDALVINPGEGRPLIDAGRLRALAVFQPDRVPFYPDVPTFKELGYDIGVSLSFFVFGPKGMPDDIKKFFHDKMKAVVESSEFQEFSNAREVKVDYMDSEHTKEVIWAEYKLHSELLDSLGLKAK